VKQINYKLKVKVIKRFDCTTVFISDNQYDN